MCIAPTLFNACMDWILGKMSETSSCGESLEIVNISDLDFAVDAVVDAVDHFCGNVGYPYGGP